jgi:DNA-binding MarR family transcriptional regulator
MVNPSDETQNAWCALLRTQKRLQGEVDVALKAAKLPPLTWYDILWELEKTDQCGLRAFEMQPKLLLTQYGLSRILSRMQDAGLIQKQNCPEDGRGQVLGITEKGRETRAEMWEVYGNLMHRLLGEKLTNAEMETLGALLNKL